MKTNHFKSNGKKRKGSSSKKPIGVFDSGVGGLTVLKAILDELPGENVVYFGDTAHVPYGTKSKETVTRYSIESIQFLQGFNIKSAVIACNSASSMSLDTLRDIFTLPIVGVIEPGVRSAIRQTKSHRVGVIGTRATISSGAYERSLKQLNPEVKVCSASCPLFVSLVEEGWLDGKVVRDIAKVYLKPLKNFGIDTLILGCTHYPLLTSVIQDILGSHVKLIDSARETAKEVRQLLGQLHLIRPASSSEKGEIRFYVSDEPEPFRQVGERFFGRPIASVTKVGDYVRGRSAGIS